MLLQSEGYLAIGATRKKAVLSKCNSFSQHIVGGTKEKGEGYRSAGIGAKFPKKKIPKLKRECYLNVTLDSSGMEN